MGLLGLLLGAVVEAVTPLGARDVAAAFYTVMTVAALGFTAWLALRRRPLDPVFSAAAVLVVAVATAPIIQPWYLLWVLPLLACALRPLPWAPTIPAGSGGSPRSRCCCSPASAWWTSSRWHSGCRSWPSACSPSS